ncbi:MAG: hypothetical protein EA369_01540 [Bradymonadales bacterium]|nr:MAG: hypothetical protein EA369_01540 [Bradymonadales bacterium]
MLFSFQVVSFDESYDHRAFVRDLPVHSEFQVGGPNGISPFDLRLEFATPLTKEPLISGASWSDQFWLRDSWMKIGDHRVELQCARIYGTEFGSDTKIISFSIHPSREACETEGWLDLHSQPHRFSFTVNSKRPSRMLGPSFRFFHNDFRVAHLDE